MQIFIYLALIGWIPVCLLLFVLFPQRQAILIGILGGWLFLPAMSLSVSGLPDYSKTSAFAYGILLSLLIFAPDRFTRFRPCWLDLPLACYVVGSFVTSIVNDLGAYDGLSVANSGMTYYGAPYLIGRVGFENARDLRELCIGIVVAGLAYVPFCLVEMAVGPILASKLYAVYTFAELRLGGYRPHVFLSNGLELGLWMAICSLIGVWLWWSGAVKRIAGIPLGAVLLPILLLTTLFCRSSGALVLLGSTLAIMWASRLLNHRVLMYLWIFACFIYMAVRILNFWDYSALIESLAKNFDADRAQSLEFRFQNEDMLIEKALQRPILGWGGFGRSRVYDETGKDVSITDGLWIIVFGTNGIVGVTSLLLVTALPAGVAVARIPPRRWRSPEAGPIVALAGGSAAYLGDILMNGFQNGVILVSAGAMATVLQTKTFRLGSAPGPEDVGRREGPEALAPESVAVEERVAARYVEMARGLRQKGDYEGAVVARRHARGLFARLAEGGRETAGGRRGRLDCDNDLAWLLATRPDPTPGDREEAADLARRTVEAAPDNSAYWNTLALVLCRVGRFEEAQASARRSMELDETWNGFDLVVLALTDARIGRKAEAAPWLAEAVRWRDQHGSTDATLDELIRETQAALGS